MQMYEKETYFMRFYIFSIFFFFHKTTQWENSHLISYEKNKILYMPVKPKLHSGLRIYNKLTTHKRMDRLTFIFFI